MHTARAARVGHSAKDFRPSAVVRTTNPSGHDAPGAGYAASRAQLVVRHPGLNGRRMLVGRDDVDD